MLTVLKCVFIFHAACINTDVSNPSNLTSNVSLLEPPESSARPFVYQLLRNAKLHFALTSACVMTTGDDFAITLMFNNVKKNQESFLQE